MVTVGLKKEQIEVTSLDENQSEIIIVYECSQFGTTEGLGIWAKLIGIVGPGMAKAIGGLGDGGVEPDKLSEALTALLGKMEEKEVVTLIKRMCANVRRDGKAINFETEFAANYGTLVRVLWMVIRLNYSSFLSGAIAERFRVAFDRMTAPKVAPKSAQP